MPIDVPGADTFPANVQVPADADPADGASVRTPLGQLADRTRYLKSEIDRVAGYVGGADGSSEWVYPAARTRTILLPASAFIPDKFTADTFYDFDPLSDGDVQLQLGSDSVAIANLAGLIPSGANNVRLGLIIEAGSHLVEGKFFHVSKSMNATPVIGARSVFLLASVTTTGLQNAQHPTAKTDGWGNGARTNEIVYHAGTLDGGSYDYIQGAIITFTDPGPRNY